MLYLDITYKLTMAKTFQKRKVKRAMVKDKMTNREVRTATKAATLMLEKKILLAPKVKE